MFINKLAERLRELRQEKCISIKELSAKTGISPTAISQWENNKRVANIDSIILLANYFGVSVGYIVGVED